MEFIIGGGQPKTLLGKIGVEKMVDWSKVNLPKYNPHQFELARHLDGLTRSQYAKVAGITVKRYTDIEKGDIAPTEEDVCLILAAQSHVIKAFYEQWPETEIDCSGYFGKPVAIDYYKYKVFRDINPPHMKLVK